MDQPLIDTPEKAARQFDFIRDEMREHFVCLTLNAANRLIACRIISIGTLTANLVHPREVFINAITDHAASIIVGHNHPSGDLSPSINDRYITTKLIHAGAILGIEVLDHLIITKSAHISIYKYVQ